MLTKETAIARLNACQGGSDQYHILFDEIIEEKLMELDPEFMNALNAASKDHGIPNEAELPLKEPNPRFPGSGEFRCDRCFLRFSRGVGPIHGLCPECDRKKNFGGPPDTDRFLCNGCGAEFPGTERISGQVRCPYCDRQADDGPEPKS